MKLYTWLVDKFVLIAIGVFAAVIGTVIAYYIHAVTMEVFK